MKKQIDRCMGCMNEKRYSGPCEICGYIDNDAYPADCLAPRTFLNDRYILGKLISRGGDSAVYLAFDTKDEKAVEIREFMPDTLCTRTEKSDEISVNDGSLPLFKSYLSEYADLNKTLMNEPETSCIIKILGIFAANGTGYVVTEHVEGKTLAEYVDERGGRLTWGEASRLFPPLLDTISGINAKGIIHRGLSPETILIRKNGSPVITSVSISAARTADSEINCEIYDGYAACEQYDLSERQGSWTDVYGISAVLYRALTGNDPVPATERKNNDTLPTVFAVNEDIPEYVSDAVAAGMAVGRDERIHDIQTLKARLYDAPKEEAPEDNEEDDEGTFTPNVHVRFDVDEMEERRAAAEKKKKQQKKKRSANIGTAAGLIIFFAMVAALVIAIIYFSEEAKNAQESAVTAKTSETAAPVTEEEPEITEPAEITVPAETTAKTESGGERLMMPNFVGRFLNDSLKNRYSMLVFEYEEEYSDEYAEGIIMEQDISENTQVTEGTTVHLKVSKGAAFTYLPDYVGMKLSDYTAKLTTLGVRYETAAEETSEVKQGYVVKCSKEIGDKVYISENESVTVYYAVKPTVTEPPQTEREIPLDDDSDDEIEEVIGGDDR